MNTKNNSIIWDLFVRVFHWSLVVLIIIGFNSSHLSAIHADIGYLILVLLILRIVWGFFGTPTAKFKNFPLSFKRLFLYFKGVFLFKPVSYHGHNPAGAWITLFFIVAIILTVVSGVLSLATTQFEGMWVETFLFIDDDLSQKIYDAHLFFTDFLLALIVIHILGVFTAILQHKKNIVLPLIKGK